MTTVITPDKFDSQTKDYVDRLCQEVPVDGMLMGAIDADSLWNVKPLLLKDGIMHVLRFADPQIEPATQAQMLETYEVAKKLTKNPVVVDAGLSSMGVWLCRRFCQVTIADRLSSKEIEQSVIWYRWMYQLIQQVLHLHRHDCIHGHITPDNVLLDNDAVYLVDADCSVRSFQQRRAPLCWAPELMIANTELHRQIDVYGLSLVLEPVIKRLGWQDLFGLVTEMQNADPSVRPALEEVSRRFERFCRVQFDKSQLEQESTKEVVDTLQWLKGTQTLNAELVQNIQKAVKEETMTKSKAAEPKPAEAQPAPERSGFPGSVLVLVCAALIFGWYLYQQEPPPPDEPSLTPTQYRSYWQSGVRSKMQEVALAAIKEHDETALLLIVEDALRGSERPGVQTHFLKFIFGRPWEQELSKADRTFALKLGLGSLVSGQVESVLPLEKAHPAIVLATIGSIAPGGLPDTVMTLPVSIMSALPQPYRGAFELLEQVNESTFESPVAQALARMFYQGVNQRDLEVYLTSSQDEFVASKLLALSIALFSKENEFLDVAWTVLSGKRSPLASFLAWFSDNPVVDWKPVGTQTKLLITANIQWAELLSYDLRADLLRHPHENVRQVARDKLLSHNLDVSQRETLDLLASESLSIPRSEVVVLVSGLVAPEAMRQAMVAKWFAKEPDPELVVQLLGTRSTMPALDPFSVEAARYLRPKEWQVNLEQLQNLLLHQDPLVRALAYSRLDPVNPVHRELLTAASKVETNKRILTELMIKLDEVNQGQ